MQFAKPDVIKLKKDSKIKPDEINDDDLLLCFHKVAGFSLSKKEWCWFFIDNVQDVEFDSDAFDSLVLPSGTKRLVRALTIQHAFHDDEFDDVIKNKGKGCIFLLHGPPGVGKTALVESVAEEIKRPLYVMMSGELGSDVAAVESGFNKVLELVTKWRAVLLIDEADVFLERRSSHDLARNAMVSGMYSGPRKLQILVNSVFQSSFVSSNTSVVSCS